MPSKRQALGWMAVLLAAGVATHAAMKVWRGASSWNPSRLSDALPLFLGARAVHNGQDPTDREALQQIYQSLDIHVSMAQISTLYPASASVLLSPLGSQSWPEFITTWRCLLFGVLLLGAAAAGAGAARGWRGALGAAVGVWVALVAFPTTQDALGLGQANLMIVGLFGLALFGLARGWGTLAGGAAMLGTAVKLVPAIVVWPLLWGRRWKALMWTAGIGTALVGLTWAYVPIERAVDDLLQTIAFQRNVEAPWVHHPFTPKWIKFLGQFRRPSLGLLSLVLCGWAAWRSRHTASDRSRVLPPALGLVVVALAVDASAVGEFYATIGIPAMILLATWPLSPGAPRWSWAVVPLVAAPWWLHSMNLSGHWPHPELMVGGMVIWLGLVIRLLHATWPIQRRAGGILSLLLVAGLVQACIWTFRSPLLDARPLPPLSPGGHIPDAPPPHPDHQRR